MPDASSTPRSLRPPRKNNVMPQSAYPNWKPPSGLGSSPPRPVRLTAQGRFIAAVIAFLILGGFALGIFLARNIKRETERKELLQQQGINTSATVTRLWRSPDKEQTPHVAYRYEYQGTIYRGSVQAPLARWRELKEGSPLTVRFVPSQPTLSHPVDWPRRGLPVWFPYLMTALLAAIGALVSMKLAAAMRLLAEGRAAPGRITAVRRAKGVTVHYEFELANGRKCKGRAHVRKAPPAGEPVSILYDPDRPKRNTLYPLDLVKLDRE
jgi:hypothetical protein